MAKLFAATITNLIATVITICNYRDLNLHFVWSLWRFGNAWHGKFVFLFTLLVICQCDLPVKSGFPSLKPWIRGSVFSLCWVIPGRLTCNGAPWQSCDLTAMCIYSVETPVWETPSGIWCTEGPWVVFTVCWGAVGCEWGATSVYFGITEICVISRILPIFAVGLQYQHHFLFI